MTAPGPIISISGLGGDGDGGLRQTNLDLGGDGRVWAWNDPTLARYAASLGTVWLIDGHSLGGDTALMLAASDLPIVNMVARDRVSQSFFDRWPRTPYTIPGNVFRSLCIWNPSEWYPRSSRATNATQLIETTIDHGRIPGGTRPEVIQFAKETP